MFVPVDFSSQAPIGCSTLKSGQLAIYHTLLRNNKLTLKNLPRTNTLTYLVLLARVRLDNFALQIQDYFSTKNCRVWRRQQQKHPVPQVFVRGDIWVKANHGGLEGKVDGEIRRHLHGGGFVLVRTTCHFQWLSQLLLLFCYLIFSFPAQAKL